MGSVFENLNKAKSSMSISLREQLLQIGNAKKNSLREQLLQIGNAKKINPPTASTPGAADPQTPSTPGAADPQTPSTPGAADPQTPSTPESGICLYCGRYYKYIQRHKKCTKLPQHLNNEKTCSNIAADPAAAPLSSSVDPATSTATLPAVVDDGVLPQECNANTALPTPLVLTLDSEPVGDVVQDTKKSIRLKNLREVIENIGTRAEGNEDEIANLLEHQAEFLRCKVPKNHQTPIGETPIIDMSGYILCLGCVPELFADVKDIPVIQFHNLIKPLADAVARENQTGYWSVVDYGKGPGYLSEKLSRLLVETPPVGILVVSDRHTPEANACKETLKRHAQMVIHGI